MANREFMSAPASQAHSGQAHSGQPHSGDHYQTTFKFAGTGLARVSLTGAFVDVNQRLCDMMGYAREDLLGRRFQDFTHPDDLDRNKDLLDQVLTGRIDSYRLEKRYIKSNGEILWADLTATPERDEKGRPFEMISIVADIGMFKTAEERMNFLIEELAHRSKNLFSVMLSVVGQIGRSAGSVGEYQRKLEQRIHSLAASQNLMLGGSRDMTCFEDLARQQLSAFVEPADPRVHYRGQSPDLGTNATRVLGMALHELATNACKYGALASASGKLTIACDVVDDASDPRVVISWTEQGGPPVVAEPRSGFGRKVIERMVSRSLNAQADLGFDPDGVAWRCRVRLADLAM